jgi:hypothetical protein
LALKRKSKDQSLISPAGFLGFLGAFESLRSARLSTLRSSAQDRDHVGCVIWPVRPSQPAKVELSHPAQVQLGSTRREQFRSGRGVAPVDGL